jgi:protein gp37
MDLNIEMLKSWARMRKPHKIFVGSMTDVFGEWIPDWIIFSLFDAMAAAPRQTFQLLTKRPERMAATIQKWQGRTPFFSTWMPQNIWLGISAEDQQRFDERMPWLAKTPASLRFLSLEPLLGPITLPDPDSVINMAIQEGDNPIFTAEPIDYIDWVIIGGESGPNARSLIF